MNDQIETATETLSDSGISFGKTGTAVIASLALYGAASLVEDVVSITKKINRNRKARKAAEKISKFDDTPSEQ